MKQFGTILKFECKGYLKNKIFVGITLFLVAAIAVVMFFPRIGGLFAKESGDEKKEEVILVRTAPEEETLAEALFAAAFPEEEIRMTQAGEKEIKEQIKKGEIKAAFVLKDWTSYTYYVENLSMYDSNTEIADEILKNLYQVRMMTERGMTAEEAQETLNVQITHETEKLGVDQVQNFFYTYIMIFALYMVIMMYGQMVATNVATEKSSRAMEVLITSAKPESMMFGKVIASCLAGLFQLTAVFGSAILFYNLNKTYWGESEIITSIFDMPPLLFVYMLIFFILGFVIYAFLFGAIGSTASKLEDINTSVMPVVLIFIAGFMVVIFSMTGGSVDSLLMKICSFFPFTSPMAMFTRIAMSTVPLWEILLSMVLLVLSAIGVGVISAKIYRVGVLLYGMPPKPSAIIKAVWKA